MFGIGLTLLASVLFYRWVERRHKVLFAKFVVGIVLITAVAIGGMLAYQSAQSRREMAKQDAMRRRVLIAYVPDSVVPQGRYSPDNPFVPTTHHQSPSAFLAGVDTLRSISFRLCNRGRETLQSVRFTPMTSRRGHSSEYDVVVPRWGGGSLVASGLASDYILVPQACATLSWNAEEDGAYRLFDTVFVRDIQPVFQK